MVNPSAVRECGLSRLCCAIVTAAALVVCVGIMRPAVAQSIAVDLLGAVAARPSEGFERPTGPWTLALPEDHGPHPEARSEAWNLVVHLTGPGGTPVGVQFLLLRVGLVAPGAAPSPSPWTPRAVYRGHLIMTDGAGPATRAEERLLRGMAGLAGFDPSLLELRLDDWTIVFGTPDSSGDWALAASAEGSRVALTLRPPAEPIRPEGDAAPFRGYALPQLVASGTVETDAGPLPVLGTAWFEHLWGELPLPGDTPVVTGRLLVHLDDGTALSVIRSWRRDGRGAATVDAVLIAEDGAPVAVAAGDAAVAVTQRWRGTDGYWPVGWSVQVGDIALAVVPVVEDQEHAFVSRLWSGLVEISGQNGDRSVRGWGTLQLTGHEAP